MYMYIVQLWLDRFHDNLSCYKKKNLIFLIKYLQHDRLCYVLRSTKYKEY